VKRRQGLDWVLSMLVLAALDDPDDEIQGGIDYGLDEGPPLIQWLVLLPRKIRVVSPPRIVSLRKRNACFLKSLKAFTCSISDSEKVGKDGQVCAKCIGLAQMEHQPTRNGFAALMDLPMTRASTILVRASIFIFSLISSFTL